MATPTHTHNLEYYKLKAAAVTLRSVAAPFRWLNMNVRHKHGVEGVSMKKGSIPSRDAGREIELHIYEKEDEGDRKKPVLINWHGGAFVLDGVGDDDVFCALMASRLDCIVLDVGYRTAPEHPFPAGVHDAEDAARWVLTQVNHFDVDRVSITGFSAGANLALATSWALGPEKISSVTVFYPPTFFTTSQLDKRAPGEQPPPVVNQVFDFAQSAYVVAASQERDPSLSVLFAPAERFPHTVLVICGTSDTLYEDSEKLVRKLKESGHQDVALLTAEGKEHAFDKKRDVEDVALAKEYYERCAEAIERAWRRRDGHF